MMLVTTCTNDYLSIACKAQKTREAGVLCYCIEIHSPAYKINEIQSCNGIIHG